eukprot:scaffold2134_cov384-Prasinococcus_capsulatus_cf.AAC.2
MAFEWTPAQHIPHSAAAVRVAQLTGNDLVDRSRRSKHRCPPEAEEELLMWNYHPIISRHLAGQLANFDQIYIF